MPVRAMWKGVVRFDDVRLPVKLYAAVENRNIHFHMLHDQDMVRLKQRMVNPETDETVQYSDARRGFEVETGLFLPIDDAELEALQPEASRDIVISQFIPPASVPPQWYDRPYFLGPDENDEHYFAFQAALAAEDRAGIARWTMRKKSYIGALQAADGYLSLLTLRHSDAVIDASEIDPPEGRKLDSKERQLAGQLIQALQGDFEPSEYRDEYRDRVRDLIDRKRGGEEIEVKEDRDVHPEHILRGYDVEDGEYVIVRDDELESLEPEKSRDIDLRRFVDLDEISPAYFDRPYFLTPAGDSTKAYRLLADVMEKTGRGGIATFVMRGKEYLVAILAERGLLRAQTLRFSEELRTPEDIALPEPIKTEKTMVSRMRKAIQSLHAKSIDPDELQDEYSKQLREPIERKLAAGDKPVETEERRSDDDLDEEPPEEYNRKRDFRKTPEPAGRPDEHSSDGLRFVVQKHAARRLHYDFRIELGGALKSWAVPKGPSLDPAVKSLAVHVEDHPLEYAGFEGIIPEGEYGGGTVMIWDHGTWKPDGDAAKGYRKGRLKFQLAGEKLTGRWSLVRMAGDDGKNWLLIKSRDDDARETGAFDVRDARPDSVVTGRSLEEIADDGDRVWSSDQHAVDVAVEPASLPGARRAEPPESFTPQLAQLVSTVPRGDDWLHELKLDGYRLIAHVDDDRVRLLTRRGNDWTDRFPTIAGLLQRIPFEAAVLDGEVVALNSDGTTDFQSLQNSLKRGNEESLVYYLFDIPFCEGFDLTDVPLIDRKNLLRELLSKTDTGNRRTLRYSDHIRGQGDAMIEQACRFAMEGVISKRAGSPYEFRRASSWKKTKCLKRQEFVVCGFTPPSGSREGFGSLLLGYHDGWKLVYAGRVGTGFTRDSLRDLAASLRELGTDTSPFDDPPPSARQGKVKWVETKLVVEVEFNSWTDDGLLRHASFQGLREDKPPGEVVREEATTNAPRVSSQGKQMMSATHRKTRKEKSSRQQATVAGVRLSNPDRVLFPEQGITKYALATFYKSIAEWILPHIAGRPLTLVRCPRGRENSCFYQKHLNETMPGTLRGVEIQEKEDIATYVVVDDLPGLISLVQLGVLEFHPWGARTDRIERPDRMIFDLDPGVGVEWETVLQAARDVRDRLAEFDLLSFLRTSGGKGLHVVVPIDRRSDWDLVKTFSRQIAESLARDAPERYVATMSKSKRTGRVFIDYLRNSRGATAVASYSTRARLNAPVATPLRWDELRPKLQSDRYTVKNLPRRLAALKDDPWGGFLDVRQSVFHSMLRSSR
eukprot:g5288.t1